MFSHLNHQQMGALFSGLITSPSGFPEHFLSLLKEARKFALGLEELISLRWMKRALNISKVGSDKEHGRFEEL